MPPTYAHDPLRTTDHAPDSAPVGAEFTADFAEGTRAFQGLGIDLDAVRTLRRRFAYACLDWSERRPHIAGALGHALLLARQPAGARAFFEPVARGAFAAAPSYDDLPYDRDVVETGISRIVRVRDRD